MAACRMPKPSCNNVSEYHLLALAYNHVGTYIQQKKVIAATIKTTGAKIEEALSAKA